MIRSLCLLLPLERHHAPWQCPLSSLAAALAGRGIAVHLLEPTPALEGRTRCVDGVVTHEVPCPATTGAPEIDDQRWALEVARAFQPLGRKVHFDAVLASDLGAAALRLETGPGTVLAVLVESARCLADAPDVRWSPGAVLAADAERAALQRADLLLAPTKSIARLLDERLDRSALPVPPLLPTPLAPATSSGPEGPPRLLCVGRIGDPGRLEVALGLTKELAALDGRIGLTVALRGTDTDDPRVGALLADLATFGERLDIDVGAIDRTSGRDIEALVAGSLAVFPLDDHPGIDPFALAALRHGVPVIAHNGDGVGEHRGGLAGVIDIDDGLSSAARQILATRRDDVSTGDAALVHLRASVATDRIAELLSAQARGPSVAPRFRAPRRDRPHLAVVVTSTPDAPSTSRALRSLLEHAETPVTIGVVAAAPVHAALAPISTDPRLRWILCDEHDRTARRRNLGLEIVEDATALVAFVDGDVEVTADWWVPIEQALGRHAGRVVAPLGFQSLAPPEGSPLLRPVAPGDEALFVTGHALALTPDALERVGRFDDRLASVAAADLELALRARRSGLEPFVVDLPGVVHLAHRSCDAAPPTAQALAGNGEVASLLVGPDGNTTGEFLVLADALRVLEEPQLLRAWSEAFTRPDPAVLVLYGPSAEPGAYVASLEAAARRCGVDLEDGPRLVAKLPPVVDRDLEEELGRQIHAVLGCRPAGPAFQRQPLVAGEPGALRLMAARVWQARQPSPAR